MDIFINKEPICVLKKQELDLIRELGDKGLLDEVLNSLTKGLISTDEDLNKLLNNLLEEKEEETLSIEEEMINDMGRLFYNICNTEKKVKKENNKIDEMKNILDIIDEKNKEKILLDKLSAISDQYDSHLIDWYNLNQPKYYINMDYSKRVISVKETTERQIGVVYFISKEVAYMAFDLLREELIDLI